MICLGLHNSFQSGAALFYNNKLIGAVSEERFNRIKNYHGFPTQSIDYLLKLAKITLKDVDKIVYGMVTDVIPDKPTTLKWEDRVKECGIELTDKCQQRFTSEVDWNKKHLKELKNWSEKNNVKDVVFIDHHYSHAAGAYYSSPYEESLVFTCDGKGNFKSSSIFYGKGKDLTRIKFQTTFDSVGYFYGNVTRALGFKSERHEGKVTGLAAYGDPNKFNHITDNILTFDDDKGEIRLKLGKYYFPWFLEKEDIPDFYNEVSKYKKEDVAAAAQETVEKVITKWINYHIKKETNICLAGGIFANVKLNQKIRELDKVKSVFVQPAMGDMGIPLGSCLAVLKRKQYIKGMDLGPSISDNEIENYLNNNNIKFKKSNNLEEDIAKIIDSKKVIGLVSGRMEYGPRALCNRSIIYHCEDKSINDWLNKRLNRTEFMPFAPVTTKELAKKCFINWNEKDYAADFMTMTYDVTDEFKEKCPAAVHIDGTARPQIIRKENHKKMHSIITHYYNTRGGLALINTSFNNHEEPIVCDLKDAIDSLNKNNVDVLVIENYIISRDE